MKRRLWPLTAAVGVREKRQGLADNAGSLLWERAKSGEWNAKRAESPARQHLYEDIFLQRLFASYQVILAFRNKLLSKGHRVNKGHSLWLWCVNEELKDVQFYLCVSQH